MSQFLYVIVTGFLTIMAPMFSVIIIYKKYQLENQHLFRQKAIAPQPSELEYSDSLWPFIFISTAIVIGLVLNIISLI